MRNFVGDTIAAFQQVAAPARTVIHIRTTQLAASPTHTTCTTHPHHPHHLHPPAPTRTHPRPPAPTRTNICTAKPTHLHFMSAPQGSTTTRKSTSPQTVVSPPISHPELQSHVPTAIPIPHPTHCLMLDPRLAPSCTTTR